MKRCPHCDRVETDDTLTFCRTDGTPLVIDSLAPSGEAGTAKFSSKPTENQTSILPHATEPNITSSTGPTTVLPAVATTNGTRESTKPKRNWVVIAVVVLLVAGTISITGYLYFMRKAQPTIQSIAMMPFINESGNTALEYLSDGMTETLISSLSLKTKLSGADEQKVAKTYTANPEAYQLYLKASFMRPNIPRTD